MDIFQELLIINRTKYKWKIVNLLFRFLVKLWISYTVWFSKPNIVTKESEYFIQLNFKEFQDLLYILTAVKFMFHFFFFNTEKLWQVFFSTRCLLLLPREYLVMTETFFGFHN